MDLKIVKRSFITEADQEKERMKNFSMIGGDNKELSFYKGKDLMLPELEQEGEVTEDMKELAELKRRKERLTTAPRENRRESVREYIKNTRSILLAKIAMHEKKIEAKKMKEYIQEKELILNLNKDTYEKDKAAVNKYVEFMNNEAFEMKKNVDKKAKEREAKEAELDRLIQLRANIKKDLGDNKEICATYKSHMDFLNSLNPDKNKSKKQRPHKMVNRFFVTESGAVKDTETGPVAVDKELQEIKDELGLSENDSESEIDPCFSTVGDFIELMNKQAADNLSLIEDSQKREESLERMKKEYEQKIQIKSKLLGSIQVDLKELRDEEKRKSTRLKELIERTEMDALNSSAKQYISEEKRNQMTQLKRLKRAIKRLIMDIKNIYLDKNKSKDDDPIKAKDSVAALTYVTDCLLRLKMIRDWKFMTEGRVNLLKNELEEKDRAKQLAAKEARTKNMEIARKKRENLRNNWKIPRYRKFGKETMKPKVFKEGPRKKEVKIEAKVDNEFDDKYFVDY